MPAIFGRLLARVEALDVSRGDVLASGEIEVGHRFEAEIVWMDERPLDPARVYLLKQATRVAHMLLPAR